MPHNVLISILTPAYKAENTIERAVWSVLAQTYSHWEMLIVSDDKVDYHILLKNKGIEDPRLRFASTGQTAAGPSLGRNIALDMAKGEYITTLDADDEYRQQYLAVLLEIASAHGVAMIRVQHEEEGAEIKLDNATTMLSLGDYVRTFGCNNTMFARKLLQHRYVELLSRGEDFLFDVRFFEYVDTIPMLGSGLYIYHLNPGSLTGVEGGDELFVESYKRMIAFLESEHIFPPPLKNSLLAACHYRLFQNYLYIGAKARGECSNFPQFIDQHPEYF